jgi:hypothetical protein
MPIVDERELANFKNAVRRLIARFFNSINEEKVRIYAVDLLDEGIELHNLASAVDTLSKGDKMPNWSELLSACRPKSSIIKEMNYTKCEYCNDGIISAFNKRGYEYSFRCRCDTGNNHGEAIPIWDSAKYRNEFTTKYSLKGERPGISRSVE